MLHTCMPAHDDSPPHGECMRGVRGDKGGEGMGGGDVQGILGVQTSNRLVVDA